MSGPSTTAGGVVPGVAGLLLTGGTSRRMGADKAALLVEGRSLAERTGAVLASVAAPVLEVGPGRSGLAAVADGPGDHGPLLALVAGADALAGMGHAGPVLVLATDLPFVGAALLAHLATRPGDRTVVPVLGGRAQSLCARYSPAALDQARRLAAAGVRSLGAVLAATEVDWVDEEEWSAVADRRELEDVDTPGDLRRLGLSSAPAATPARTTGP